MDIATSGSFSSRARRRVFVALLTLLLAGGVAISVLPGLATRHATAGQAPARNPAASRETPPLGRLHQPGATDAVRRLTRLGLPVFCGAGTQPVVALTFDDGPGILSPEALRTLRAHDATATFFLVGKLLNDPWLSGVLRKEVDLGAAFGDHTWSHVTMTGASPGFLRDQVARTRRAIRRRTGEPVLLFRPPLGAHDRTLDSYLRRQGILEVLWSIDSQDSQAASADRIYRTIRRDLSPGDIILLHDNRGTTEKALPGILDLIDRRGLTTVTVPQLLASDPPTNEQLRRGTCG